MQISQDDERYLLASIARGEAIPILGAGASANCTNKLGHRVKTAAGLAKTIAEEGGFQYQNESLVEVLGAVRGNRLSDVQIRNILTREYRGVTPSPELESLFTITWKRVYTWNIDDSIDNIKSFKLVQRLRYYNGMTDKVADYEGPGFLHIIYLHGQVVKPEHGFILTESDYNIVLKGERHFWYKKVADDYLSACPIFVGTSLAEPILSAELDRAKRDEGSVFGRGYLITTSSLTEIKKENLRSKGIVHVQASLRDFTRWLATKFPSGLDPKAVIARSNRYSDETVLKDIANDELDAARQLRPVEVISIKGRIHQLPNAQLARTAREYLRGFPITWELAASDIPVWLASSQSLYEEMKKVIAASERLMVVTGQSGSGKTTAIMQCILRYLEENPEAIAYEVLADIRSVGTLFRLLKKLHRNNPCILYMADLYLYGDSFRADLENLHGQQVTVISTARSGEWREHFIRHLGDTTTTFSFQRFERKDYEPLIQRLDKYVPAPAFQRLSRQEKIKKLASSKHQLLIALRETTESRNFDEIITNEYETLPDQDTKHLFITVGISTLARVGIGAERAADVYEQRSRIRPLEAALSALEGIVSLSEGRRFIARHELYVRHIIENVASFQQFVDSVIGILRTFTMYEIPVIRRVNRQDSHLFKFLLNHDFILQYAKRHGVEQQGRAIYEAFEIDFQLDGHFWLQYGQYLIAIKDLDGALQMLRKSIQAFPANQFALHALAALQLRIARQRHDLDALGRELISEAVETLLLQDSQRALLPDQYPMVTLALGHLGALVKHGETEAAKKLAPQYFDRLQQLYRETGNSTVQHAMEKVLRFITFGEWSEAVAFDLRPQRRHSEIKRRPRGRRVG